MAQTADAVQAVLDSSRKGPTIARGPVSNADALTSSWFVMGGIGVRVPSGQGRWCTTTDADSAATQGASILTQMN